MPINNPPIDTGVVGTVETLTVDNKAMVPLATSSDGDKASDTALQQTPAAGSYIMVKVNGVYVQVGDGVKTSECYFSADGGATARAFANVALGDTLHWNGTVANYELAVSDEIDIDYLESV